MTRHGNTIQAPTFKDVAEASALITALALAWLYLTGWTYAYHYFDRFRIPLLMVNIPLEHYFVYGGIVLQQHLWWVGLFLLVIVVFFVVWRWLPAPVRRRGVLIAGLVTLLLFWLGRVAGVNAAHTQFIQQRTTDYRAYPRVQLWPTAEARKNAKEMPLWNDLPKGCYRLLLHNQDRLFLFRSFKSAPAADVATVILPWRVVASVRVLPEYTSCP